jgi:hypothetical protein
MTGATGISPIFPHSHRVQLHGAHDVRHAINRGIHLLDIIETAVDTIYDATINSETLAMYDRQTGEPLEAVAVIPGHAPDLVALVNMVPPAIAGELARLAAWRALGIEAPPPRDFDA